MWLKLKSCTPYCQATSCGRCTCRPPPSSSSPGPGSQFNRLKTSWKTTWKSLEFSCAGSWLDRVTLAYTFAWFQLCHFKSRGSGKYPKMLSLDMSQNQIGMSSCFQVVYQIWLQLVSSPIELAPSFWLERSAIPARVSLGVTTVLSITTLLSNSNDNLPPTAYPKVQ